MRSDAVEPHRRASFGVSTVVIEPEVGSPSLFDRQVGHRCPKNPRREEAGLRIGGTFRRDVQVAIVKYPSKDEHFPNPLKIQDAEYGSVIIGHHDVVNASTTNGFESDVAIRQAVFLKVSGVEELPGIGCRGR